MLTSSYTKLEEMIDNLLLIFDKKKANFVFQNCIKVSKNKQESRKFISKPIQFNEIMEIDQKLTDLVYGYINKVKSDLHLKHIPFSTIPKEMYYLCLLYVDDSFPKVIRDIYKNNVQTQIGAVREIRILLSSIDGYQESINHLIKIGVIPQIIQILTYNQHPQLQYECLWSLVNVALDTKGVTHIIRHGGHIQLIKSLKSSSYYQVKHMAMYVLYYFYIIKLTRVYKYKYTSTDGCWQILHLITYY